MNNKAALDKNKCFKSGSYILIITAILTTGILFSLSIINIFSLKTFFSFLIMSWLGLLIGGIKKY